MTAQTLKPGGFRAVCQRGHELETFADRDAFEAHMAGHGARKLYAGKKDAYEKHGAPGWRAGKIEKPYPHTAPKPQRGGLEKIAAAIAAGAYDVSLYPSWKGIAPERMGEVVTCEHEGAHHSDDTVTVFRGRPAPETLCGYHASQIA